MFSKRCLEVGARVRGPKSLTDRLAVVDAGLRLVATTPCLRGRSRRLGISKARQRFSKFTFLVFCLGEMGGGGGRRWRANRSHSLGNLVMGPSLDRTDGGRSVLNFRMPVGQTRGTGLRPGRLRSLGRGDLVEALGRSREGQRVLEPASWPTGRIRSG